MGHHLVNHIHQYAKFWSSHIDSLEWFQDEKPMVFARCAPTFTIAKLTRRSQGDLDGLLEFAQGVPPNKYSL